MMKKQIAVVGCIPFLRNIFWADSLRQMVHTIQSLENAEAVRGKHLKTHGLQ